VRKKDEYDYIERSAIYYCTTADTTASSFGMFSALFAFIFIFVRDVCERELLFVLPYILLAG
jgi:hypothetical protein